MPSPSALVSNVQRSSSVGLVDGQCQSTIAMDSKRRASAVGGRLSRLIRRRPCTRPQTRQRPWRRVSLVVRRLRSGDVANACRSVGRLWSGLLGSPAVHGASRALPECPALRTLAQPGRTLYGLPGRWLNPPATPCCKSSRGDRHCRILPCPKQSLVGDKIPSRSLLQ